MENNIRNNGKKVLFVLSTVGAGGTATSLLNLLQLFKEKGFEFDLFLENHDGVFIERAKRVANLLPEEPIIAAISCNKSYLRKKGLLRTLIRFSFVLCHKIFGVEKANRWYKKQSAKKLGDDYDVVVAYQEERATEYAQYIGCKKRVAWCHMDYAAFSQKHSRQYKQNLYNQFKDVVCVSEVSRNSMLENLDLSPSHVHLIYNTIPSTFIRQQAELEGEKIKTRQFTFVSVGRFVKRKGFDRVVYVASELKKKKIDFSWYLIGDGEEFANIQSMIKKEKLEDCVYLLGVKENPFIYIKQADCYVMSSSNEAQPMVLNEALTLGIPVITTDFKSSREVVAHGENGLIISNDKEGLLDGVMSLIQNPGQLSELRKCAQKFVYDNEKILNQVWSVIDE